MLLELLNDTEDKSCICGCIRNFYKVVGTT